MTEINGKVAANFKGSWARLKNNLCFMVRKLLRELYILIKKKSRCEAELFKVKKISGTFFTVHAECKTTKQTN